MVDLKNQNQQTGTSQKSDPKGQGRRQFRRYNQRGEGEQKKKDPDAVPILKYGPSNNFMIFKEALSKKA